MFQGYCKLAVFGIWACQATHTQRDTIDLRKTFVFIGRQKINFTRHVFLRCCKDVQTYFGYFGNAWLHTPQMIVWTCGKLNGIKSLDDLSLSFISLSFRGKRKREREREREKRERLFLFWCNFFKNPTIKRNLRSYRYFLHFLHLFSFFLSFMSDLVTVELTHLHEYKGGICSFPQTEFTPRHNFFWFLQQ